MLLSRAAFRLRVGACQVGEAIGIFLIQISWLRLCTVRFASKMCSRLVTRGPGCSFIRAHVGLTTPVVLHSLPPNLKST